MATTLENLQPGEEGVVQALNGEPETMARLMEMGLVVGTTLKVVKFAPLGDPIEILVRGYHFSLRRAEASQVTIETAA